MATNELRLRPLCFHICPGRYMNIAGVFIAKFISMKTVNEMLAALTAPFIKQLEAQASVFKLIGAGWLESPRWFQYRGDKNEQGILYIGHSQCDCMFIKLDISMFTDDEQYVLQHADYMKVYDHFRKIKYAYLRKNHPTIEI